jgi:hypothetical protein
MTILVLRSARFGGVFPNRARKQACPKYKRKNHRSLTLAVRKQRLRLHRLTEPRP